jgi:hypothetical protein
LAAQSPQQACQNSGIIHGDSETDSAPAPETSKTQESDMAAAFSVFRASTFTTWESLCEEVAVFITKVGKQNIIGVTQSEDRGDATIIVWYWQQQAESEERLGRQ